MSTYSITELMQRWRKGELTAEQAVGYLLQNLEEWFHWRTNVEKRLRQLEQPSTKPQP
ncbi:MAG TPA: hypothetical protein PKE45_25735 [Caldilineaceae bacterium]|nr:hypothetical protein [Caldilineaceae bacterium]